MPELRRGIGFALVAYVLWGGFPLYFSLLAPANALEIVAHRVVWCFVFLLAVLLVRRRWAWVRPLVRDRRRLGMVVLGAAVMVGNWLTYNWAVNHELAVEGSLGYFISPLMSVLIGVLVLRERLRRTQWIAVGIATAAVLVMTVEGGRLPWIALVLAATFAFYGVIMKFVDTPPVEAVAFGMGAMFLPMVVVLAVMQANGSLVLGHTAGSTSLLLLGCGLVTAVPLVFFGAAAPRVPLSTMGLLQYVNPVLQFVFSVAILHETLTTGRWVGFSLVWVALVVFSVDGLRSSRRPVVDDAAELVRP